MFHFWRRSIAWLNLYPSPFFIAVTPTLALDPRAAEARHWALSQLQLDDARFEPASADASFRRYFRMSAGGQSWVLMDAPPERENCQPFIHIAGLMERAGLNAPRIHAQDLARGYLLLSDLGTQTFLHVITEANADELFAAAIDALIVWQRSSHAGVLPEYDAALLRRELALFPDWYVARHLQCELTAPQQRSLEAVNDHLVSRALAQSQVFVHRDYMPRNLMISTPNPGVLDFQDAVYGPISYDVISLFKDAFLSWPEARIQTWLRQYWEKARQAGLPVPADYAAFQTDIDWMGMQRHLKVIGIFARIHYRDGKAHYLQDVPRFIRYVRDVAARYEELQPLITLFDQLGMSA